MRDLVRARPVVSVVALQFLQVVFLLAGAAALAWVFPALPGYSVTGWSQSLVLVLICAGILLALIAVFRWWVPAGFTRPRDWRQPSVYWLPAVLLLVPFLGGVKPVPASALGLLLLGYLATAVFEEGFWRGVMVRILLPVGVWPAVLISSLLFGLAHLANSALRGVSVIIAAQAFGAAVQGIGFAALRLHTNTVWPLIALHAAHDLFLQMGTLPIPLVEAPVATITAIYGIIVLRRHRYDRALDGSGWLASTDPPRPADEANLDKPDHNEQQ